MSKKVDLTLGWTSTMDSPVLCVMFNCTENKFLWFGDTSKHDSFHKWHKASYVQLEKDCAEILAIACEVIFGTFVYDDDEGLDLLKETPL